MIRRKLLLVGLLVVASAAIAFVGGRAQAARPVPPKVGSAPVAAAKPRLSVGAPRPASSFSTVIYSNLGPGDTYDPVNGWCIDGTAAPGRAIVGRKVKWMASKVKAMAASSSP